jgi:hypothetical protein
MKNSWVRIHAGRKEAVHVTDDGNGPPFAWFCDDGSCPFRLLAGVTDYSPSCPWSFCLR